MPDQCGQTPFHVACELGYLALAQFLWKEGSDINAAATIEVDHISGEKVTKCVVCVTPLHIACIYAGRHPDYSEMVRKLLEWRADVKLVSTCGCTEINCDCPYSGRTAREILSVDDDFRAARDDLLALFQAEKPKRKRTTPVIERTCSQN